MNRFILGIGAFILTFGISTSLVGLFFGFPKLGPSHSRAAKSAKANIMRVLDRDIYNGEKRRNHQYRLARQSKAAGMTAEEYQKSEEFVSITEHYVSDSSAIDVSNTPADFAYAWNDHMTAWNSQVSYLKSVGNPESSSKPQADNGDRVTATWFQVLRIAKRYRVPMKARYYE